MAEDEVYDSNADEEFSKTGSGKPGATSESGNDSGAASSDELKGSEEAGGGKGLFGRAKDYYQENFEPFNETSGRESGLYRDEPQKKQKSKPGKKLSSRSNLKKRLAIAGAAAGGSVIVGLVAFLALLPLKIESLVKNLESHYFAASENAIDKEVENEFNQFVAKEVLPNFITRGSCVTTADPSCVSVAPGTGPVDKLFNSWRQGRLEEKLATQYGIVIGKRGTSGQLYMNVAGQTLSDKDLHDIFNSQGKVSMFDLPDTSTATRSEIRVAVRNALQDATFYDKVYFRFKVGKLLESKYGIKRCVIACDTKDKFTDSIANKKLAAQAYLVERVVSPYSQSASLMIQCLLSGGCSTDVNKDSGNPEDPEKTSDFQKALNEKLASFAATYGEEKLAKLVESANTISKDGFTKWIFSEIVKQVAGDAAGEAAGELADGAGTVNFIANAVNMANNVNSSVKKMNYAIGAAAAVSMYMTFRTVVDEVHSGHMDSTELGSFTEQMNNGGVDATSTPLYNSLFGNSNNTTTAFTNILEPSTYAAAPNGASASSGTYLCRNGKPVPSDQKVCNEEILDGGNGYLNSFNSVLNSIPGWGILTGAASLWRNTVGLGFNFISNFLGSITQYIPGVSSLEDLVTKAVQPLITLLTNVLVVNPLQDAVNTKGGALPSGGRTFDLAAGGADVIANKSCEVQLGCSELSPAQIASIQNDQAQQDKLAFNNESLFARMFSTSSQYSLVSRLAMDMPTSLASAADSGIGSLLSNPIGKLGGLFSSLFSSDHAFAGTPPQADPFGVSQYGLLDSQIPSDPQGYWNQNCQGDYMTAWENSQTEDPNTGDTVSTTPNICMFIQSTVQSAGGFDDSSLLPTGSQNP